MVKQNDGKQRNSDQPKISEQPKFFDRDTLEEEQKMEEDLDFFFNNNAIQPKKRKYETKKNKTVQHDKNKVTKFLD